MARLQSLSFETATTIATVSSSSIQEDLFTLMDNPGALVKGSLTSGNTLAIKWDPNVQYAREIHQSDFNNWKDSTLAGASDYDQQGEVYIFNIGGNRYTVNIPDVNNQDEFIYLANWLDAFYIDVHSNEGFTVAENTDGLSDGDVVTSEEVGSILNVTITPPISVTTDSYGITGSLIVTGDSTIIPPTSDPGVSGALWNNNGTLSISAG